jgi:hypothetical protein
MSIFEADEMSLAMNIELMKYKIDDGLPRVCYYEVFSDSGGGGESKLLLQLLSQHGFVVMRGDDWICPLIFPTLTNVEIILSTDNFKCAW